MILRPSYPAERTGNELWVVHVTEAPENIIFVAERLVDAGIHLVDGIRRNRIRPIVIEESRVVRGRIEFCQGDGIGFQPVRRQYIAGKYLARKTYVRSGRRTRRAGSSDSCYRILHAAGDSARRGRVEDLAQRKAPAQYVCHRASLAQQLGKVCEPTANLGCGRNSAGIGDRLVGTRAFVIYEEESLVVNNRASQRGPELVLLKPAFRQPIRIFEIIGGVQGIVPKNSHAAP